jgi:hypothetical protein
MCDPVSMASPSPLPPSRWRASTCRDRPPTLNAKYSRAGANANAALALTSRPRHRSNSRRQEAARRYREAGKLEGQQQAAMAANGIDINYGSAVDLPRDKMIAGEDVGTSTPKAGEQRTMGYLMDAYNYRLKAEAASLRVQSGLATGFGMLGTALGAASQLNKMKANPNFGG